MSAAMRVVALSLCGVAVATAKDAAFSNPSYSKAAPAYDGSGASWPSLNTSKSTYARVHASQAVADVTEFYFGANLPVYLEESLLATDDQETKMVAAGVHFLRYPGGSPANKCVIGIATHAPHPVGSRTRPRRTNSARSQ